LVSATGSANTGDAGRVRIVIDDQGGKSAAGNYTDVRWWAYWDERTTYNFSQSGGTPASVVVNGVTVWSGSFAWNWTPAGLQSVLIASGERRVNHNADGTKTVSASATVGNTGTTGGGGGATASTSLALPTLKVIPGVPTKPVLTRISDTQTKLTWTQTSASNGQPTQNLIQESVNNGPWTTLVTINATTTATVATSANEKTRYRVRGQNTAGNSNFSPESDPIYTTPAAPTGVAATKQPNLDIVVNFTANVPYTEHEHEVWHGVDVAGVITWDGAVMATLPSGTTSYTHVAPNAAQKHVYRVRAKAGALLSGFTQSNVVQLLVAPNAPVVPAMPAFADKAEDLVFSWQHNSVDTTAQTAYEFAYSTDGGTNWTSSGKVVSTTQARTIAGGSHAANVALTTRVRTWGAATTGGSEGTGASPWSALRTVTYKTKPTGTITSPADGGTITDGTLRVDLAFAQPEAATFVKGQIEVYQDGELLETKETTTLLGTTMLSRMANTATYTVSARVQDSNGLWSAWDSNTFNVEYLMPVAPEVTATYVFETGWGQLDMVVPEPGAGEEEAFTISISRTVNGVTEVLYTDYPAASELTFLDTTPSIHGLNIYTITTKSELGAENITTIELETEECRKAFLSKGQGFSTVVVFGANLEVNEALSVASDTVSAAGRTKPIGLYGTETSVVAKVSSFIFEREGFSTIEELRAFLLLPGRACYRDASGRRIYGSVRGSVGYTKTTRGELNFTMTETS
jgi:hypothetical protein